MKQRRCDYHSLRSWNHMDEITMTRVLIALQKRQGANAVKRLLDVSE